MAMLKAGSYPLVLINDPKVLAVPIREVHENLCDLRQSMDILYGPSPEIENNQNYTWMRYTVYKKLKEAQMRLPAKYRFCLYEAYRHPELQDELFKSHLASVKVQYPEFSEPAAFNHACKLFSPLYHLDGSLNIPPHSTGAAIDVYLVDPEGQVWDMGIHPKDWKTDVDASLTQTNSGLISEQAKKNRALMSHALHSVGFVNYPTEYWHWSYGDRYWAYIKQRPYAMYGSVDLSNFTNLERSIITIDEGN
jgi:D-alanyl-D-alanine dipeptidase